MKCSEIIRELSAYQDNELSLTETHLIKKHLNSCDECNLEYRDLTSLRKKYSLIPDISTTKNLTVRIMAQINQEEQAPSKLLNLVLYGFLLLILIGFGFLFQANIPILNQSNHLDYIKDQPLISMVINKENTSIINFSEDICQSFIPDGEKNAK